MKIEDNNYNIFSASPTTSRSAIDASSNTDANNKLHHQQTWRPERKSRRPASSKAPSSSRGQRSSLDNCTRKGVAVRSSKSCTKACDVLRPNYEPANSSLCQLLTLNSDWQNESSEDNELLVLDCDADDDYSGRSSFLSYKEESGSPPLHWELPKEEGGDVLQQSSSNEEITVTETLQSGSRENRSRTSTVSILTTGAIISTEGSVLYLPRQTDVKGSGSNASSLSSETLCKRDEPCTAPVKTLSIRSPQKYDQFGPAETAIGQVSKIDSNPTCGKYDDVIEICTERAVDDAWDLRSSSAGNRSVEKTKNLDSPSHPGPPGNCAATASVDSSQQTPLPQGIKDAIVRAVANGDFHDVSSVEVDSNGYLLREYRDPASQKVESGLWNNIVTSEYEELNKISTQLGLSSITDDFSCGQSTTHTTVTPPTSAVGNELNESVETKLSCKYERIEHNDVFHSGRKIDVMSNVMPLSPASSSRKSPIFIDEKSAVDDAGQKTTHAQGPSYIVVKEYEKQQLVSEGVVEEEGEEEAICQSKETSILKDCDDGGAELEVETNAEEYVSADCQTQAEEFDTMQSTVDKGRIEQIEEKMSKGDLEKGTKGEEILCDEMTFQEDDVRWETSLLYDEHKQDTNGNMMFVEADAFLASSQNGVQRYSNKKVIEQEGGADVAIVCSSLKPSSNFAKPANSLHSKSKKKFLGPKNDAKPKGKRPKVKRACNKGEKPESKAQFLSLLLNMMEDENDENEEHEKTTTSSTRCTGRVKFAKEVKDIDTDEHEADNEGRKFPRGLDSITPLDECRDESRPAAVTSPRKERRQTIKSPGRHFRRKLKANKIHAVAAAAISVSKAERTDVSASSASKAERTDVSASSASKAERTDVSASSASKAERTDVSASSASKAERTDVSASSASKAERTDVSASSASKAERTDVSPSPEHALSDVSLCADGPGLDLHTTASSSSCFTFKSLDLNDELYCDDTKIRRCFNDTPKDDFSTLRRYYWKTPRRTQSDLIGSNDNMSIMESGRPQEKTNKSDQRISRPVRIPKVAKAFPSVIDDDRLKDLIVDGARTPKTSSSCGMWDYPRVQGYSTTSSQIGHRQVVSLDCLPTGRVRKEELHTTRSLDGVQGGKIIEDISSAIFADQKRLTYNDLLHVNAQREITLLKRYKEDIESRNEAAGTSKQNSEQEKEKEQRLKSRVRFADVDLKRIKTCDDPWNSTVNEMLLKSDKALEENKCSRDNDNRFPRPDSARVVSAVPEKTFTFLSELLEQDMQERQTNSPTPQKQINRSSVKSAGEATTEPHNRAKELKNYFRNVVMHKHYAYVPDVADKDRPRGFSLITLPRLRENALPLVAQPASCSGILKIKTPSSQSAQQRAFFVHYKSQIPTVRRNRARSPVQAVTSAPVMADNSVRFRRRALTGRPDVQASRGGSRVTFRNDESVPQNGWEYRNDVSSRRPRPPTGVASSSVKTSNSEDPSSNYLLSQHSDLFGYYTSPFLRDRDNAVIQMFSSGE